MWLFTSRLGVSGKEMWTPRSAARSALLFPFPCSSTARFRTTAPFSQKQSLRFVALLLEKSSSPWFFGHTNPSSAAGLGGSGWRAARRKRPWGCWATAG